ncbi:MAG: hypothetical protein IAX21_10305 [Candidatus Bathyarchaeota archaeon]|nr:hypothetical protein [Candidatus Bathyarchaeum tardum]WGM88733.1 MAG: hypothetical protein NUK63_07370 [Candidatus Bathyarchaeum tardum]WNZ29013.1 MAG: hypothetical protein IAX21_10305 [Candidatus Bathyarchaeota archaeon]
MEPTVLVTLIISAAFTVLACFAGSTKRTIHLLVLQATAIGFVGLMSCIVNLIIGLHLEALIDFFASFSEWFACAIVSPLIIYWGMVNTKNEVDQPIIGMRMMVIAVIAIAVSCLVLGSGFLFQVPLHLEVLPFVSFMLALSILLITTRKDPLKILIGFNMAETALYPLISKSPLVLIPFILAIMIFVNIVGVFVISEAYKEYGTSLIDKWRWND